MGGCGRECPSTRVALPPPTRCRRTDADAYKECLVAYMEGLIAGGVDLHARLLERETRNHDSDNHRNGCTPSFASKAGVDLLSAVGNALRHRRKFLFAACGALGRG